MSLHINMYLAIDDDTPSDLPPFSHHPSVWSLDQDVGLSQASDQSFLMILGCEKAINGYQFSSLKGVPTFLNPMSMLAHKLGDDEYVTWIMASDLSDCVTKSQIHIESLNKSLRVLLDTITVISNYYGKDRIALICSFIP